MRARTGRTIGLVGLTIGAAIGALALTGGAYGYGVNLTISEPPGLWRVAGAPTPVRIGEYVTVCPPRRGMVAVAGRRGYIRPGDCPTGLMPLLKQIAAVPGDVVTINAKGVQVNGRLLANSQAQHHDTEGRKLTPISDGQYQVAPGTVWLISSYSPLSFDSRYFGPVAFDDLRQRAFPLIVEQKK